MTSKYPNGFTNGLAIRNIPLTINPSNVAKIYWVDSTIGKDSTSTAGTVTHQFASIAYAVAKIYNSNSAHGSGADVIYVAANHVETVASAGALTLNVPGLTIVFMGNGSKAATINFTTAVTASMIVSASNVTLINPRFTAGIDALTGPISVTGADFSLINGTWYDAPAKATTNCIVATNTAARMTIDGWKYFASTTGAQKLTNIKFSDVAYPVLRNISITGDFGTAPINATAAATNVLFDGMVLNNLNATPKPGIDQHADTTGMAKNVDIRIASGVAFVSDNAKLNYDNNCLGYAADGTKGTLIGS